MRRWQTRAELGPGRTEATEDLRRLGSIPGCLAKWAGGRLIVKTALILHPSMNPHPLQGDVASRLTKSGAY